MIPMKLVITTGNEAFRDPGELPRLLRKVADQIERGRAEGRIMDVNGNRVGAWSL